MIRLVRHLPSFLVASRPSDQGEGHHPCAVVLAPPDHACTHDGPCAGRVSTVGGRIDRGRSHAHRIVRHLALVDPVRGGQGHDQAAVRDGRGPLRRRRRRRCIEDLDALRQADRFRFANELRAWVEVEDGKIVGHGQAGGGHIGATTMKLGLEGGHLRGRALSRHPARARGRRRRGCASRRRPAAAPACPRPAGSRKPPFVQITAPMAWSTLALTIHADGRTEHEVVGASPFPRHWVYDHDGKLAAKSGMIDFKAWYSEAFGKHSPWGDEDSPALVTEVETALERQLSSQIMKGGAKPKIRKVKEGKALVEQGAEGDELFLLLDGVLSRRGRRRAAGRARPGRAAR